MEDIKKESKRPWPLAQKIALGVVGLVVLMVLVGTLSDAAVAQPVNPFLPQRAFTLLAFVAFVGGVLSFLSPCTLPILPAYFAFAVQSGRQQIALNTMVFLLGVAAMFSAFGAGASAVGALLQSNQTLILLMGGALVLIFGVMSLMGQGFTGLSRDDEHVEQRGLWGSFIFGLTFAAGWTTCIGPILGIMLTMAATTGSVLRGALLLFIYALGLGLPLVLVSTLIGRLSRQHIVWRILRGKGWFVETPNWVVAAAWGLVAGRILIAAVAYAFTNTTLFAGQQMTAVHTYGLLAIGLAGAFLWMGTSPTGLRTKVGLQLHSTQFISGVLFVALALLMLNSELARITAQLAGDGGLLAGIEESLYNLFLR